MNNTTEQLRAINELATELSGQPSCQWLCPEGKPCVLLRVPFHNLHSCGDEACACHSQERYAYEKRRGAGR